MEKKESRKEKEIKNSSFEDKKVKSSLNKSKNTDKSLPWWVEFLFVQIGLPDKWLIKILKSRKLTGDFLKNEKKYLITLLFFLFALIYFYPVIKYSRTKIQCQNLAKKYIKEKNNLNKVSNKPLKMLSTNFCNGGNEVPDLNKFK